MNAIAAYDALEQMARLLGVSLKDVGDITHEYEKQLSRFAFQGYEGLMDATDLARAHRALIRTLAPKAYTEGMKAGGIEDATEMDDDDRAAIAEWVTGQLEFVRSFAKDAVAAKLNAEKRNAIQDRVGTWAQSMQTLGDLGRASAQGNAMGTWKYGDTEHCDTCRALNGQRKRLKTWIRQGLIPQQPGSTSLDCGGWNCQCKIIDDRGRQLLPA